MTAALEIHGLEAGYGRTSVLHGLDLVVPEGVTAILGPSGCGKTTLLRTVAGFVTATRGTVAVGGTEVVNGRRSMPARLRGLGYVRQDGALFPHLDVAANIAFGLSNGQRATAADRVAEMLALVELPAAMAGRFPHELSGGQQQRVALARALAPRPTLVLLDEPFSSLDASLREDTGRAVVRALSAAGAAALLVTHDQGEALSLADQVAVMMGGSFLQVAPPAEVYLTPADPRVASFLGHASLVDGKASGGSADCALGAVPLRGSVPSGPVRLAVRAEQIQIRPAESEGTPAEVVDISFYGHDATVRVRLDSGEELSARTPATSVPAPGDRVRVGVVGDVVAFAE